MFPTRGAALTLYPPVSVGEVVDKMTILRIKTREIDDASKLANVHQELEALETCYREALGEPTSEVAELTEQLEAVNMKLWRIEDDIRNLEFLQDFGPEFLKLARSVYRTNDQRAALKRQISQALGSSLVEEKSYKNYLIGE